MFNLLFVIWDGRHSSPLWHIRWFIFWVFFSSWFFNWLFE